MSTTKPSPETIQIARPKPQATASSLMGFSNPLPECPSTLPDGTILDYSAVDETWKDVVGFKSPGDLEESIFKNHQATKLPPVNPVHLLKHITRVQSLAALVPSKSEEVDPVEVVKFDKPQSEAVKGGKGGMKKWMYKKDPTDERMPYWRSGSAKGTKPKASGDEVGERMSHWRSGSAKGAKSKQSSDECDMGERMSYWRSKSKKSA